ncbi:MAG: response regulator [Longimicrobiales bacterium]
MTTVLFVEDHPELCAIHTLFLQKNGYRVLTVMDGPGALVAARQYLPDVIVLDHSLPGLTGVEVARELKADPSTARIPILMMTAHAYGAIGRKARAAGCATFVAKPCQPSRLLEEVRRFAPT